MKTYLRPGVHVQSGPGGRLPQPDESRDWLWLLLQLLALGAALWLWRRSGLLYLLGLARRRESGHSDRAPKS